MDQRMIEFIAALRASGVRVSLAESADAFKAVETLGVTDRDVFKVSLSTTLVKEKRDQETFEKLFPLYFQPSQPPPMENPAAGLDPEEARMLAQALRRFNQELREMMEKLLNGEPLSQREMKQLDQMLNSSLENDLRYQNWVARQMEAALNFKEVRQALEDLLKMLNEMGMNRERIEELRRSLKANQKAIQEQLRQHAGEQILRNLITSRPKEPQDGLLNQPFHSFSEEDMHELRKEIRRLAAVLRSRLALRLHRAHNGQLDLKATLRANLKHGSVPIELRRRDRIRKPKLVVICDISTSMRYCSELMLSLLYAIQDQISKTSAFTFIDHLEYISPYFDRNAPNEAIDEILQKMPPGHYNTDLGYSLDTFRKSYLDTVDHRTTFIIVGDGRNNFNDPRLDLFKSITHRARSTIWLNPEPQPMWGTGDSDMQQYAPLCDRTFQVANLRQLAAAIDQLLLH